MPRGAAPLRKPKVIEGSALQHGRGIERKVVYVPTCVTRMMGPSLSDTETGSVHMKIMNLLEKVIGSLAFPASEMLFVAVIPVCDL